MSLPNFPVSFRAPIRFNKHNVLVSPLNISSSIPTVHTHLSCYKRYRHIKGIDTRLLSPKTWLMSHFLQCKHFLCTCVWDAGGAPAEFTPKIASTGLYYPGPRTKLIRTLLRPLKVVPYCSPNGIRVIK